MPTQVNALTIRVQFQSGPAETPSEVWTLTGEPDEFQVDERALDQSLFDFARETGHGSTLMLQRRYATGAWGASGLSVMEVVVTVALGAASNAAYAALVALYKRFAGRDPNVTKAKLSPPPARSVGKGRSKKQSTRKPKRRH